MIEYVTGEVVSVAPDCAVLDVEGVGVSALMSSKALATLPAPGQRARIYTVLSVTDSQAALYGFSDPSEREMYTRLVGVKGVGPKAALSVLSTLTPAQLAQAISAEDDASISQAPGVGKKSAQRIILELKGAIDSGPNLFSDKPETGVRTAESDATAALLGMGFSPAEAEVALKGFDGASDDVGAAVRYALQRLGASS